MRTFIPGQVYGPQTASGEGSIGEPARERTLLVSTEAVCK